MPPDPPCMVGAQNFRYPLLQSKIEFWTSVCLKPCLNPDSKYIVGLLFTFDCWEGEENDNIYSYQIIPLSTVSEETLKLMNLSHKWPFLDFIHVSTCINMLPPMHFIKLRQRCVQPEYVINWWLVSCGKSTMNPQPIVNVEQSPFEFEISNTIEVTGM